MATNNAVNVGLSGSTGTGNFVGATSPTLVTPVLGVASATSLKMTGTNVFLDSSNQNMVEFSSSASAVNYLNFTNGATTIGPVISAVGTDTNIGLVLEGKGTQGVLIQGTTSGTNTLAGFVGEVISSVIASGSAVSLSNNTTANVTSISLTAGDWDVWGNINVTATGLTFASVWSSTTSVTQPDKSLYNVFNTASTSSGIGMSIPYQRYNFSSTTTVYLSVSPTFVSAGSASGGIYARRAR